VPELPEVETVRRQLAASLTGCTFVSVDQVEPAMLRDCSTADMHSVLPGARVESVNRLGKFLLVGLRGGGSTPSGQATNPRDHYLTLHLGMTGQLLVDPPAPAPHLRFAFTLKDDGLPVRLEFGDTRKFGRVHLTHGAPAPRLAGLGPDAWQGVWDAGYLRRRAERRKAPLKAFLLDQRNLAGIGNIYADEILWWSELSPLRETGSVGAEAFERLADRTRRILGEGVRLLGCSFSDFVDTAGKPGTFQDWLRAYGKQGQPCTRCGTLLVRVVVAGRGTAFCPSCQH
jgi:formamidopyrimidine-DNA glycosylase